MFAALAEKHGVAPAKLRATPQNDILKEYVARGTYIFPPRHAMRLFRNTLVFLTQNMHSDNITSGGSYHIREEGATARIRNLLELAGQLSEGIEMRTRVVDHRPSRALVSMVPLSVYIVGNLEPPELPPQRLARQRQLLFSKG